MADDMLLIVESRHFLLKDRDINKTVLHHLMKEAAEDIAAFAAGQAQFNAPKRTGNLVANITATEARLSVRGYEAHAGVRKQAIYGKWVEQGTGLYGPSHMPIRPTSGNVLVFVSPGFGLVFARSVKGQKGQRFLERAYVTTKETYLPARLKLLKEQVGNLV